MKLKFSAAPCELCTMRDAARRYLREAGVSDMEAELMVLALDEACANIIRHAYGGPCKRPIRLTLERTRNTLRCTLRDYGTSCDPRKIRSRDLTDFRPGGLGVRIMRTAFDTVDYEPMPRGTRLRLCKSLRRRDTAAAA